MFIEVRVDLQLVSPDRPLEGVNHGALRNARTRENARDLLP